MHIMKRKIFLIVDDKRDVRSLIRAIVENSFHEYDLEILTAPSSDIALQIIEKKKGNIDLISTNIHRPGMDGYSFMRAVKERYPHIQILICSGSAKSDDLREVFDENLADGYIRKPFHEREYRNTVRNIFYSQNIVRVNFR